MLLSGVLYLKAKGEEAELMPTINQLIRKPRKPPVVRNKVPALEACPQKRGVCTRVDRKSTRLNSSH